MIKSIYIRKNWKRNFWFNKNPNRFRRAVLQTLWDFLGLILSHIMSCYDFPWWTLSWWNNNKVAALQFFAGLALKNIIDCVNFLFPPITTWHHWLWLARVVARKTESFINCLWDKRWLCNGMGMVEWLIQRYEFLSTSLGYIAPKSIFMLTVKGLFKQTLFSTNNGNQWQIIIYLMNVIKPL